MHRKRWTVHHLHLFDLSRHTTSGNPISCCSQYPDRLYFSCTSQHHICRDLYYSHSHLFVLYNAISSYLCLGTATPYYFVHETIYFVGLAKVAARYGCGDGVESVIPTPAPTSFGIRNALATLILILLYTEPRS